MSSGSTDVKKRCKNCSEYVKIYITCFKCDAAYHIYCWKKIPGAYVNQRGQLFCCGGLTSNYASVDTNLETQDNPLERVVVKGNIDGYNEDLENYTIKQENYEWNEFKCDACLLEFTNKEHLENHYSECPHKAGESIQKLKEDKDLNCRIKQEDFEWNEFKCDAYVLEFTNEEHLENHYSECPNKEGESVQDLKEDKDLESYPIKEEISEWNEFKCDACLLEFMNKEHLESHYSECPNKEGESIQELKEEKDYINYLHKEEDLEWSEFKCGACLLDFTNIEQLENHYRKCPNKEGEPIQELKDGKDVEIDLLEENNSEPIDEHLKNHCSKSPNKQGGSIRRLHKDKVSLFRSSCKKENFQKESYKQHIKRCQAESSYSQLNAGKEYKCKHCEHSAHSNVNLLRHMRTHTNERPFKCDVCDYAAAQKNTLSDHIRSKHSNADKEYRCGDCTYSTHAKKDLIRHMRTHTNLKPFKCDMCDYAAALKATLTMHVRAKHSAEKMYKCRDCEYSTHRKTLLVTHVRVHSNEKPFKCDRCDYATARKENLNVHILAKHSNADKEHKCKHCKYSTHTKNDLVKHVRIHTNEKPFQCYMCEYAAVQKSQLKAHILTKHSNADKEYKCKDCKYSALRKRDLVNHIRIHTNEKPFKCDMCDYAAALKGTLNTHVAVKHSNAKKM